MLPKVWRELLRHWKKLQPSGNVLCSTQTPTGRSFQLWPLQYVASILPVIPTWQTRPSWVMAHGQSFHSPVITRTRKSVRKWSLSRWMEARQKLHLRQEKVASVLSWRPFKVQQPTWPCCSEYIRNLKYPYVCIGDLRTLFHHSSYCNGKSK